MDVAQPVRRSTEIATWTPFRELDDIHARMAQLLHTPLGGAPARTRDTWVPGVDIEETDEAYVVEAELPGVQADDVTVELLDGELSIRGEVKERERVGVVRRRSRRTGRFGYRVAFPAEVDADSVQARLADGVLRVEVRKAPDAQPRRIEVRAA